MDKDGCGVDFKTKGPKKLSCCAGQSRKTLFLFLEGSGWEKSET